MANRTDARIYLLAGISAALAVASFIVPRFVTNPEGGFASGASAILTLLVLLAAALLFSLYLLAVTLQHFRSLSIVPRILGVGPSLILAVMLFGIVGLLRY